MRRRRKSILKDPLFWAIIVLPIVYLAAKEEMI